MELIFHNQLLLLKRLYKSYTSDILAAIKENNGAAMSLGRVTTFLDSIWIET